MSGATRGTPIELAPIEKLAVAQAFVSSVGDMVKTKVPDNLRGEADAYYRELYEQTGAKSFDVKLLGEKVGTFSVVTTKPTESREELQLKVIDEAALLAWAIEHGFVTVDMDRVSGVFAMYGEMPDGCEPERVVVPGDPGGKVKFTKFAVDSERVVSVLGPQLADAGRALLTEGA